MDNREIVDRYLQAFDPFDLETIREIQHPDIVSRYPQSGETFQGQENYTAMQQAYPGLPQGTITGVTGASDMVVMPSFVPFGPPRITVYNNDNFVVVGILNYPNGEIYHMVLMLRMLGGKVKEETWYFAAEFDAPEWRRPYTE